jgi:hypothetical protein
MNNIDILSKYNLLDYDKMHEDKIDTKIFTENMDNIEIIDNNHMFIIFLSGFTHKINNIESYIIHGWYHKKTQKAKFFIKNPADIGNTIYIAWQKFCKIMRNKLDIVNEYDFIDIPVSIYSYNYGQLYESNEYKTDEKTFYKEFLKQLIDNTY